MNDAIIFPLFRVQLVLVFHMTFKLFFSNPFIRYFQAGGSPENVIQLLSENYTAVAQTVNLLAEWLIQTGTISDTV